MQQKKRADAARRYAACYVQQLTPNQTHPLTAPPRQLPRIRCSSDETKTSCAKLMSNSNTGQAATRAKASTNTNCTVKRTDLASGIKIFGGDESLVRSVDLLTGRLLLLVWWITTFTEVQVIEPALLFSHVTKIKNNQLNKSKTTLTSLRLLQGHSLWLPRSQ